MMVTQIKIRKTWRHSLSSLLWWPVVLLTHLLLSLSETILNIWWIISFGSHRQQQKNHIKRKPQVWCLNFNCLFNPQLWLKKNHLFSALHSWNTYWHVWVSVSDCLTRLANFLLAKLWAAVSAGKDLPPPSFIPLCRWSDPMGSVKWVRCRTM